MKILSVLTVILLFQFPVWGDASLRLEFPKSSVTTGEIVKVKLLIDPASTQSFPVQSMRSQTLDGTLYIQSLGPLLRRDGDADFSSEAEIVFIKVPEGNGMTTSLNGQNLNLSWNNVRIDAVEVPKDYILGDFTVPSAKNFFLWILIALLLLTGVYGIFKLRKKLDLKNKLREEKKAKKNLVLNCKNFDDVVSLWKQKQFLIQSFPHLQDPFTRLETVLFRYQFKPSQTQDEKDRVMEAYRTFRQETEGGFHGI